MERIIPDYQKFDEAKGGKRITRWLAKEKLNSVAEMFIKYHGHRSYGREFIIKSNRRGVPKFAIFVCKDNKQRRQNDIAFKKPVDMARLYSLFRTKKIEGISILKTMSNSL